MDFGIWFGDENHIYMLIVKDYGWRDEEVMRSGEFCFEEDERKRNWWLGAMKILERMKNISYKSADKKKRK